MSDSIIRALADAHVAYIEVSHDNQTIVISEACDDYYNIELTKADALQLIEELQALINQIQDTPHV